MLEYREKINGDGFAYGGIQYFPVKHPTLGVVYQPSLTNSRSNHHGFRDKISQRKLSFEMSKKAVRRMLLEGVKRIFTKNESNGVVFNGLSFLTYNPQYPESDIDLINQDKHNRHQVGDQLYLSSLLFYLYLFLSRSVNRRRRHTHVSTPLSHHSLTHSPITQFNFIWNIIK